MRITKVYTRAGDGGQTALAGGRKVRKDHPRVACFGTVDELNSVLGVVRSFNRLAATPERARAELDRKLRAVQNDLFRLGAELATPADAARGDRAHTSDADVRQLESWIDELNGELEPLREFILPGGPPVAALLHQARTTCRRAEREIVSLAEREPELPRSLLRYVNRLSDLLFVAARWAAQLDSAPEELWVRTDRSAAAEPGS